MDNLFELIILLVFILSGINTLFGKKKKRREQMEQAERGTAPESQKKKVPQDERDLLEEIFGMKQDRQRTPDPFEEPGFQKETGYKNENYDYEHDSENTWNPEEDFKNADELKPAYTKTRQKIFEEISKIDYEKAKPKKTGYEKIITIDKPQEPQINIKALGIRKILKNRNSIKDSIIIAEILSKPKALRFRGNNPLR